MKCVFTQKDTKPTNNDLKKALCGTYALWDTLVAFTKNAHAHLSVGCAYAFLFCSL